MLVASLAGREQSEVVQIVLATLTHFQMVSACSLTNQQWT